MNSAELTQLVIQTLEDNKARDITELDVTPLTNMIDAMVICSATSGRHAKALADKVLEATRKIDLKPLSVEGEDEGEWVLIDLHDIVVHIMQPETREFYNLEKLWTATETARQQAADAD